MLLNVFGGGHTKWFLNKSLTFVPLCATVRTLCSAVRYHHFELENGGMAIRFYSLRLMSSFFRGACLVWPTKSVYEVQVRENDQEMRGTFHIILSF